MAYRILAETYEGCGAKVHVYRNVSNGYLGPWLYEVNFYGLGPVILARESTIKDALRIGKQNLEKMKVALNALHIEDLDNGETSGT